jgi:hypothetical protein
MVSTELFIQMLNERIHSQEKRLTALRKRVPDIVLQALPGHHRQPFTGFASGS